MILEKKSFTNVADHSLYQAYCNAC